MAEDEKSAGSSVPDSPQDAMEVDADASNIIVGCKLQVQKTVDEDSFWREAEVLAFKNAAGTSGALEYYVHYTNFNKRLDEWVTLDKMNLQTIKYPKPEKPSIKKGKGGHSKLSKANLKIVKSKGEDRKSKIEDVEGDLKGRSGTDCVNDSAI
jgi:RNA binding activity-knot of a chromodomain